MTGDQKIALVTGASRGIGKAIATALAESGAFVLGTATSDQGASAISESLGGSGRGFVLDVGKPDSIAAFFEAIKEHPPLILVNNAGITRDNLSLRMKDEEWTEVIETNLS